jgi:molybdopterin-containing oxidoreductase family iron-sulfur binding subunit
MSGNDERRYWRSLEELGDTPEFREALAKEFLEEPKADRVAEQIDGTTRRHFLGIMGASLAMSGLAGCVRRPERPILPYVHAPEDVLPGVAQYYATATSIGGRGIGLVVEAHEGRPTKIEGNPEHPMSLGGTTMLHQGLLLDLYDPQRLQNPQSGGKDVDWNAAADFLRKHFADLRNSGGEGVYILSPALPSPTLADLRVRLLSQIPRARWLVYEPVSDDNQREGLKAVLGEPVVPDWRLEQTAVVVSLDADFLGTEGDVAAQTRRWADSRRMNDGRPPARLYAVEGVHSLTGSNADHRLRVRTSQVEGVAFALALALADEGIVIPDDVKSAAERLAAKDVKPELVKAMAHDLARSKGQALVIPGRRQPAVVHALAAVLNEGLEAHGKCLYYFPDARRAKDDNGDFANLRELAEALNGGKVDTLLVLGSNPVYSAPGDLGFADAYKKAKTTIALSDTFDETARLSKWVLPRAHFLETWGDVVATDGTASIQQPLIAPIHGARSEIEVVALALGNDITDGYGLVREFWKRADGAVNFHARWRRTLHDGKRAEPFFGAHPTYQKATGLAGLADNRQPAKADGLELVFLADYTTYDGRFASNSWLQEAPDPMTKVSWDNPVVLSPATARKLGVGNEERVKVEVGGKSIDGVAWILPGVADDTLELALGYGRDFQSYLPYHDAGRVGFDVNPLRGSQSPDLRSGGKLSASGGTYELACVQRYSRQDPGLGFAARPMVRETDVANFQKNPTFAKPGIHKEGEPYPKGKLVVHPPAESLYEEFDYSKGHQWGMVIDLNTCTGCNACLVACVAENNIPPVGKDQVRRGREMHWIRMDRYFTGDENDPQVVHQPMPCQQCENAPCENVCPVAATSHSPEGLNDMAYNRCVGTRYCANNCPFKVRRFNFYNFAEHWPEVVHMSRNPNVTVRFRGVMEKCTYCVQRINVAKRRAKLAKDEDGAKAAMTAIQTACAQACPGGAIVFGDINDPSTKVAQLKKQDRDYGLLTELNVKPRTSYLAKIRNPNPEIKG